MFWGLFVAVAQKALQRCQEGPQRGLVGVKDAARFLPVAAVAVQFEREIVNLSSSNCRKWAASVS